MAITTRRFLSGWALACCALLAVASPLRAEKADREKPVNLEADRVTIDDAKQTALFEGDRKSVV